MTVKEALIEYMKANRYEGLVGDECGCVLDELMPCGVEGLDQCELGHIVPCPKEGNCECEGQDDDTHIVPGPVTEEVKDARLPTEDDMKKMFQS